MTNTKKPSIKVIVADKLYISYKAFLRLSITERKQIKKLFIKSIFDVNLCELKQKGVVCKRIEDYLEEHPGNSRTIKPCIKCPMARKTISCIFTKKIKNKKYLSIYRGDKASIKKVLDIFKKHFTLQIQDKRVENTLSEKQQFRTQWNKLQEPRRTEQKKVAEQWLKIRNGACILPPRSGKTILTSMIAAKLKQKTIVIAHQKELLEQFRADWLFATTLKEENIKINPTVEEAKKLTVCLYTVQQFRSKKGKEKLQILKKLFGLLVVDEVHKSAAPAYSKVLNQFRAKYRLGVTATYNRRDQRQFIVQHTLGLPSIEGGIEMLSCNYRVCTSNFIPPEYKTMNNRTWGFLWKAISNNNRRNEYIAALAVKDVLKGHKIIIPVKYIKHVSDLSEMIRDLLRKKKIRNVQVREYAAPFLKNPKFREQVAQEVREGKYEVVVAISQMISLGFNAPPMSALYLNVDGYKFDTANLYQQYSRIRTPCKGKQTPLIRVLQDKGKISESSTEAIVKELERRGFNALKPSGIAKHKKGWNQ